MKKRIKITALFVVAAMLFGLMGCSLTDKTLSTVTLELDEPPVNIDPLLAKSNVEWTLVRNVFEPLCRVEDDGTVSPAAAESFSADESGLVYTFILPENSKWFDGTPLTANDFVFSLQRAVSPATKASCAVDLQSIKNAPAITSGSASPESLGVSAKDDRTLVITLEKADKNLLHTLSNEAGIPCNADFFNNCKGKYGLSRVTTMYNGSFCITSWVTDQGGETMSLKKNEEYKGKNPPTLTYVEIEFDTTENRLNRISKEESHLAPIPRELVDTARDQQLKMLDYINSCNIMLFNSKASEDSIMSQEGLRKALILGGDWQGAARSVEKSVTLAKGFVPEKYFVGLQTYGENHPTLNYDVASAKELINEIVSKTDDGKIPKITLSFVENPILRDYLNFLVQSWQKNIGVYVTLNPLDKVYLENAIDGHTFDIAVTSLSSIDNTAKGMFSDFLAGGDLNDYAPENLAGLVLTDTTQSLKSAQQSLIDNSVATFMYFSNGYYVAAKPVNNVRFDNRGNTIDLSSVK